MSDVEERFWSKVDFSAGCWEWAASRQCDGYGWVRTKTRMELAHRVAYHLAYGAYDPELCVLHYCDNPPCCRPDHLFLGTRADNNWDKVSKGRGNKGRKLGTHCVNGHLYTDENTYISPKTGHRQCRTCRAEKRRKRKASC